MNSKDLIGAKVVKVEGDDMDLTGIDIEKDGKTYHIFALDAYDGWGMGYYEVNE